MPVIVVVRNDGVVIVAVIGPLTWLQPPVPVVGLLAAMVADPLVEQIVWSGPALLAVGTPFTVITTSSVREGQGLLLIVQRSVYVPAPPAGVKVALLAAVLLNWALEVEGPETTDHAPEPTEGALAARVAVPLEQIVWSLPAFEGVACVQGGVQV
jgi:hypothetical protein